MPSLSERIENSDQLGAFLGFVNSQWLVLKTTIHPNAVVYSLLKTRLAKKQGVQQIYRSSKLGAEAANPLPEDLATESAAGTKKRGATYLDKVLAWLTRRFEAAVAQPVES